MKKPLFFLIPIIILIVLVIIGAISYKKPSNHENFDGKLGEKRLFIDKTEFVVEIADTDESRVLGLSGRESLDRNRGLLFIFNKEDRYGIWMKDMNFPIDIAWINKNKEIINIEHNVATSTYPEIFYPKNPSLFVLELNAGVLEENKIKIGDVVNF